MIFCANCGFGTTGGAEACPICGRDFVTEPIGADTTLSQVRWSDQAAPAPAQPEAGPVLHAPGRVLWNRYKVLRPLGRGAMGLVLLVEDLADGSQVALKVMVGDADRSAVARFRRELKIARELQHPHAVRVFDAGLQQGTYFFTMEYVAGGTLGDLINPGAPLPLERVLELALALADVLHALHGLGIVHRDFKPGNVLLTPEGEPKLADFGIAKVLGNAETTLTRTGMMAGTPRYMAPEQMDAKKVDARADLYALGAVLYELCTGRPPFTADSAMALALAHLKEAPVPPSQLRADLPPQLERTILRLLEKDPARRFQSGREVAEALTAAQARAEHQRMANGDTLVLHRAGSRYPVEIFSREPRPDWEEGQVFLLDERYLRLIERVAARAPFAASFRLGPLPEVGALRGCIDYRAFASRPPPRPGWLKRITGQG